LEGPLTNLSSDESQQFLTINGVLYWMDVVGVGVIVFDGVTDGDGKGTKTSLQLPDFGSAR